MERVISCSILTQQYSFSKIFRSDGESQFSSDMVERLKYLLKYQHLIIIPYHPHGNSMAERRMKEVGAHLRALVYEYRIKSEWSHYLPLVQRNLNYTVDGSIGTQPGRVQIYGGLRFGNGSTIGNYWTKSRRLSAET